MRRAITALLAATAAIVLLTGCIGGGQPTPPPVATIEQVDVPDTMVASAPSVSVADRILTPGESLPWLVGGARSEPGEGGVPTVWTSVDGTSWAAVSVDPDFEGSFSGSLGGSAELAALGGTAWREGVSTSVLWTSEDGQEWTARDLPESFAADFRINDVAVAGSTVYAIATDVAGQARGLRLSGDDAGEFELPAVDDDEVLGARRLLATGDTLVLLAAPGPEGDPVDAVSFVSDDEGKTWSKGAVIAESPAYVAGIAAVDDGFVATGAAARDSSSNATGAAAWFSPDGRSWTAESVPVDQNGPLFYASSADAWLGAPLAGPGGVSAVLGNDNAAVGGVFTRDAGGAWFLAGQTGPNPSNGLGGTAVSTADLSVVLMGGSPYARIGTLAGGGWVDVAELAPRQDLAGVSHVYAGDDTALVTVSTSTFTVDADLGWSNRGRSELAELTDDTLAIAPWDPERAGALASVVLGSDGEGAEVLLGSYFDTAASTINIEGWFRAAPDAAWTPVAGFPAAGATSLSNVARIGEQWIAVGTTRASSAVGDAEHGVVWTSADGLTWTAPGGEFGEGSLESSVADVCTRADGGALAVGWIEESAGEYRTAVWTPGDGGWQRADIGDLGSRSGFGTACASDEDGVVLAATVSGRDTLQRSTDGAEWDEVFRADRGIALGEPVAVPGGFAASGSLTEASFSGPVVWLSADGVDWSPLAIPSFAPGETFEAAPYGEDLVVAMSSRIGHPVSVVRDIEKVIGDTTG